MKIGGVIKINNKFLMVVGLLFLLLFVRFVCADDNLLENLAVEDPLYYDKDTFESKVYNSKTFDNDDHATDENTADYYKNLNPYQSNELLPNNPMSNSLTGGPMPGTLNELSTSSNDENNEGIPFSQIPSGSENLYVLKSKIVPPVCPRCPDIDMKKIKAELGKAKCPPCPACARCPDQPFTCKKVPNYKHMNPDNVPGGFLPRMSDTGSFT